MPSFILIRQIMWPQYAVTDRTDRQRSDSIGRTVLQTVAQKLEMWANAQRDSRPAEHRWRPLFNVRASLTQCGQGKSYLRAKFHLDPCSLATIHQRYRQTGQIGQDNGPIA